MPPNLRRITLHLDTEDGVVIDPIFSLDWKDLDRTFCRIPSLTSFVIDVCPGWGPPPLEKRNLVNVFKALVPMVHRQGILEVRDRNVGEFRSVLRYHLLNRLLLTAIHALPCRTMLAESYTLPLCDVQNVISVGSPLHMYARSSSRETTRRNTTRRDAPRGSLCLACTKTKTMTRHDLAPCRTMSSTPLPL